MARSSTDFWIQRAPSQRTRFWGLEGNIYKYSICVYYNACVLYGNGTFISANGMIYVYWYKNMFIYIYMYIKIFTCIYRCLYTYLYCGEINFCRVFQPHSIVADEAAIDHRCAVLADSSARALKIRKMWKISGENPSGKDVFSTSMLVFSRVWWVCVYIYIYIWYMYVCFVYVYTYVHNRIYLYTYKKRDEKTHLSQVPWMKRLQARIWNGGYMLQYTNYIRWSVSPIAIYIICYFLCNYFSYIPCSAETGGFVQCMDCSMPRLYPIDIPLYLMYTSFRYHLYTVIYRLYPI